jgi:Kef-type K+ transport system membrane component KefB
MVLTEGSIFSGFPAIASPLAQFIVQLVIILSFTRLIVLFLKPLRQPAVIGEVIAGILLGPSALSRIPAFKAKIFPEDSISRLQLFANVALVLFMFTIGLELDFRVITKNLRKSVAISLAGILVPFGLGAAVAVLIQQHYATPSGSYVSFVLFGGTAMSITAFPVLARILSEMRLLGTKVGATTMNAAAVDDVLAWTILAVVIATARASDPASAAWTVLSALAFMGVMAFIVRPILRAAFSRNQQQTVRSNRAASHGNDELPSWLFVSMVILCFVCAYTTEVRFTFRFLLLSPSYLMNPMPADARSARYIWSVCVWYHCAS